MWGDPRPNRMDPFRRSQEERFSSGWNRDFLSRSDGLGLERNSGGFQGGREPSRPFEMSGMLGPTGRSFPNREEPPFSFASRGGALTDFRAGERMALDFQARNLQARELSLLDLRAREAAEFRSREAHLMELRSREGLMMDYRARDGLNSDFRNRELLSLEFKERIAPHMDYREREILADLRSRELLPDFRGRGMLDMDFRSKEQPHADVRGMNISDNDFRNRNLPLSDFRSKEGPQMNFLGNTSTLDFRGKDGSQVDFRARDVPHSDFRAAGTSDLDFRGREETMFNFQSSERPRTDQDFRDKDRATGPVDFIERVRLPPNQPISDYTQSQPGVRIADEEFHESRIDKTGDSDLVRPLYSQEHQTDNQGREGQSVVPPPVDVKNSDGPHTTVSPPEQTAEPTRQTSPTGEQRPQPGRGVKRGVDLDFLGRQDTDYRNMDYQDVDLRFDYGHGKSVVEERASKDAHQDNQMGKSGRSAAKSIKISQATAPHARSDKDEHGARNSEEDFDGFVQRISSAVSAALDPKNAKVADVDQDYRPASGEESASRFIQIQGLPATADKEEIIEAFRAPDGNPIEDLQLSDYNPGGVISVRSPPKEVWICGHSLVQCAKERARRLPQGTQLGISCHKAKITWMGEVGMKWDQLIPTMKEMIGKPPAPDLIVVHLGENDLMQITGVDLIIRIKKDLRYLMALFPRAHIMWSSLLPRRVWLGAKKPAAIDRTRKEINREVKLFCRQAGMLQLQHDAIRFESPHQFSKDGEQLSEMGLEIFTADLQASIQGWLNVR